MLEKISICLVHPKLMGRYIVQKTWKSVMMVVVMLAINILCIGLISAFDDSLTNNIENNAVSAVINSDMDLKYKDKLEGKKESYNLGLASLNFFASPSDKPEASVGIYFNENSYSVYFFSFKIKERSYNDLNLEPFDLSEGLNKDARFAIDILMGMAVADARPAIAFIDGFSKSMDMLLTLLLMFLFMTLIGGGVNPNVRGIYRVRLIFLSLFSYGFLYWLYLAFGSNLLYFMATIISYIYYVIAARNIVKIEG